MLAGVIFPRNRCVLIGCTHMDIGKLVGHLISAGYVLAGLGILSMATRALKDEAVNRDRALKFI